MKTAIGTSLQIVPTVLMKAACFMPARTAKFMPQITIEPPTIDQRLLPPVKVPGKKKLNASISSTAKPTLPKMLQSQ